MVNKYLDRYKRDLSLKGYTASTQKAYLRYACSLLNEVKKPAQKINKEDIKDFLYRIIVDKGKSESSLRQARGSIKYFFSQTIGKAIEVAAIPYHKKSKSLPNVLDVEEIINIIKATNNVKHRSIFMMAYASGLRISEIANLRITDIKRKIMRISVKQGKGKQDRYTILSEVCLKYLEHYWKIYRPIDWLYSGRNGKHISTRAIQHAFIKARINSGIVKKCSLHTFRHSFATHMLENGGSIFQLQRFLGHKHLKTTLVYAHMCDEKIQAHSPLDIYVAKKNVKAHN